MRIAISGATGLVGSLLARSLRREHHHVMRLVRSAPAGPEDIQWDPDKGNIDLDRMRGVDAVVHLAGESIQGRWTAKKKQKIEQSRVRGTSLVARTMAKLDPLPKVLVSASAIGYYGDAGGRILTEDSPPGSDFLARVCQAWETAANPAREAGIRVVNIRTGIVLSSEGGALQQMLTPFRLGAGGRLGDGEQYMSWISHRDLVGVLYRAVTDDRLEGPVNAVTGAVTNRVFTKALAHAVGKPAIVPVPAFGVKLAFGEMGEALLLSSARVEPTKLKAVEYEFMDPFLEPTLARIVRESD